MDKKRILIIGGTGSLAKGLMDKLLKTNVVEIKVLARSESQIVELKKYYSDKRLVPIIGDIRDKGRLMEITRNCDIIFHLAALKHVSICETMPEEAVITNVIGTQNVIDCAKANQASKVVYISTAKAIKPQCTYGCTKLLGEKLILSANNGTANTKFIVFRSGNLLGSSGSVVPLFQKQIEHEHRISLTDKRMARFFMAIPQASELLIEAAIRGDGGEIFLPKMKSIRVYDLAKYFLEKNHMDETKIKITGLRPGEQFNEDIATEEEAKHLYRLDENLYIIVKQDSHPLISGGLIQKDDSYQFRSHDEVIPYQQAKEFFIEGSI
ncbi:MAG: NAD-dependent epimerase/dehydratase family protein [Methanobacterium sp.]|nr:NAD-dependent epimerase/dehydratase family protein [Methanobacterium sp.]